jgi:hypothetical protein
MGASVQGKAGEAGAQYNTPNSGVSKPQRKKAAERVPREGHKQEAKHKQQGPLLSFPHCRASETQCRHRRCELPSSHSTATFTVPLPCKCLRRHANCKHTQPSTSA